MKLLTTFLTLLSSASVLAQDTRPPNNCNTEDKSRRGSDFVLREKPNSANVASLNKIFFAAGRNVTVADVFNDANHAMTEDAIGLKWESTEDFDDINTEKWMPQGITSTADAYDGGTYEGKDGWLVSWYMGKDESVRISFVDKVKRRYRHALLVYPHAADDFRAVPVHAGGIMWYGSTLWVVDTNNGIRVFDMDNIWHVDTGDYVGKRSDGSYTAQGYKYVIPQIMWYEFTPSFEFKFSYISLDRTDTPDSILVGEYQSDSDKKPVRMAQWDLDYTKRRLRTTADGLAPASWAYCVNVNSMQGAVQADGTIYISRSQGDSKLGDFFTWTPGGPAVDTGNAPAGPEDMTYDKRTKEVFTVTEWPGTRYIINRKIADLQP